MPHVKPSCQRPPSGTHLPGLHLTSCSFYAYFRVFCQHKHVKLDAFQEQRTFLCAKALRGPIRRALTLIPIQGLHGRTASIANGTVNCHYYCTLPQAVRNWPLTCVDVQRPQQGDIHSSHKYTAAGDWEPPTHRHGGQSRKSGQHAAHCWRPTAGLVPNWSTWHRHTPSAHTHHDRGFSTRHHLDLTFFWVMSVSHCSVSASQ